MTERRDPTELRLELARGHWELDERAEAVACLERLAARAPLHPGVAECIAAFCADPAAALDADVERRLAALRAHVGARPGGEDVGRSPLATPTLAKLLAEQGHSDRALEVAEEVLRRNPDDARALAVRRRVAAVPEPVPESPGADPHPARVSARIERLELWLRHVKRRRQEVTV